MPLSIVLPVIAALSLTSEWTQRTGLTTFSLVPHRRQIVLAKALALALVAAPSMLLAFGLGAAGHLTGTAIRALVLKRGKRAQGQHALSPARQVAPDLALWSPNWDWPGSSGNRTSRWACGS